MEKNKSNYPEFYLSLSVLRDIYARCRLLFLLLAGSFLFINSIYAQTVTVTGKVVDENGDPLIGANIIEKDNPSNGTVTNEDGYYSIQTDKGHTLRFSYIGFLTKEAIVQGNTLNITMESSSIAMSELMVVAYGTTDKRTYTGSVATVNAESITRNRSNNVLSSLQGLVPGIQLENKSRRGGQSTPEIVIRGASSINASIQPLYIIDGVPNDAMRHLNPDDIESISVLKDAAAISLYGARATNGVILITTKQGKRTGDRAVVSYTGQFGYSTRSGRDYEQVSPYEYYELTWEAMRNGAIDDGGLLTAGGKSYKTPEEYATNELLNTLGYNAFNMNNPVGMDGRLHPDAQLLWWEDYNKKLLGTGSRNEHSFSISGASERINYYLSTGYLNQRGIEPGNPGFDRFTTRLNFTYKINNKVSVGTNISVSSSNSRTTGIDNGYADFTTYARLTPGLYPLYKRDPAGKSVYGEDGNPILDFGNGPSDLMNSRRPDVTGTGPAHGVNPLGTLDLNKSTSKGNYIFTNYYFDYDILENLNFRASYSRNISTDKSSVYRNRTIGSATSTNGAMDVTTSEYVNWTTNGILTYNKNWDNKHNLKLMAGTEINEWSTSNMSASVRNFAFEGMDELVNGSDIVRPGLGPGTSSEQRLVGFFSRAEYNFLNRYFLLGSIRRDGSSNFHPDTRWGNFWSLGAGWLASEETFLKDINWISLLKFRGSYGTSGNIGSHDYRAYYKSGYSFLGQSGVYISSMPNRFLKWEVNKQLNLGLDANFIKNRICLSVDLYNRVTDDLFYNVPLSPSIGFSQVLRNIGSLSNKGVELSLTTENIATRDFNWTTNFNIAHNKNKIRSLNQDEFVTGYRIYKVGQSTTEFYIAEYAGVNPENGKSRWYIDEVDETSGEKTGKRVTTEDFNETSYKSVRLADGSYKVFRDLGRKPAGNFTPKVTGGFLNSFRIKNVDFSFLFNYSLGSKVLMMDYAALTSSAGGVFHKDMLDRWQQPGDVTSIPKLTTYKTGNYTGSSSYISTFYLRKGDYLKLKNVTLGYTLPANATNVFHISSARVYMQADNVFYLSHERGFDPEQVSMGLVNTIYPALATYSVGIKLEF
ncbi:SusC/RagA family TonB-linked outer membrane protein [Petrimonas sp.]|uniref:SusC/RagA family TonB-linked outer membrane protein n=1 Tax=Petrimonas sp. TaxID=2023866 RepID=UPI003F515183